MVLVWKEGAVGSGTGDEETSKNEINSFEQEDKE